MGKELLFVLIVTATMVLFSGCIQITPPTTNAAIPPTNFPDTGNNGSQENKGETETSVPELQQKISNCLAEAKDLDKDTCLKNLAVSEKNAAVCNNLTILSGDDCVKAVALASGKVGDCARISAEALKTNCYYDLGIKFNEKEACKKISASTDLAERDDCFKQVAKELADLNLCLQISFSVVEGLHTRDECIKEVAGSTRNGWICKNFLNTTEKFDCFESLAKTNLIAGHCLELRELDANRADDCLDFVARALQDLNVCELISDENQSALCIEFIEGFVAEDAPCAEKATLEEKNSCYYNEAIENNDGNACGKIDGDHTLQDACFAEVAEATGNAELCAEILPDEKRKIDNCYHAVGLATKDIELCENLFLDDTYLDCYSEIAIDLESYSLCEAVSREHVNSYSIYPTKDLCYKNYALSTGDLSVCELITNSALKQACLDQNASFH